MSSTQRTRMHGLRDWQGFYMVVGSNSMAMLEQPKYTPLSGCG